jgi:hypothetical protein
MIFAVPKKTRSRGPLATVGSIGLLLVAQLLITSNNLAGMDAAEAFSREANRVGRTIVDTYPEVDIQVLKQLTPRGNFALKALPVLYENKLSLFRAR